MSTRKGCIVLKNDRRYMFVNAKTWWIAAFSEIGKRTGRSIKSVVVGAIVVYLAANGYTAPDRVEPSRPKLVEACRTLIEAIMAKPSH